MNKLKRQFYARNTLDVARDLLGKLIVIKDNNSIISGRIVETEGYVGKIDKAAHCYPNKKTPRTEVMFGEPGHAYVYLIYGMYHCLNIVTEPLNEPAAVLIRAIEPIEGIEAMCNIRYQKPLSQLTKKQIVNLTNGPGKLCMALGVNKTHNKLDLCGDSMFIIDEGENNISIETSKRINIGYAQEAADFPWRFFIKGNPYVSVSK
ncbi:DNA-3-methyladenine glycosylase [Alkaliphilus pronyensis]|uniref:Putative 3-methyladenine DNA glycosylase n=1 Tax=Alkaliphilus pronyensis TaxID=1482732 RepID=A0A6I0FAY6_9FIRM|nr:DNA-3-methyladenine glycosylase [Alkaliphilus pronyensis]KAB3534472.1 DNA-3-methyladenine glycosylase [Alkaliphilus pronyensis]